MLKRIPASLFLILILFCSIPIAAQTTIEEKIERKISISPYLGVLFFPTNINFNDFGQPKNLFAGYPVSPIIGVGAYYKYNKRVQFGSDLSFMFTGRDINGLNIIGLSAIAKLYPLNSKKRIAPYFLLGMNVSFINISQPKQVISDSVTLGPGIPSKVDHGFNELNLYMAPMFGPVGGVGLDVKVSRKISVFVQASLQTSFGSNSLIQSNFPENESALQYMAIKGGVTIKLFKKMKFEIDTEAVRIPDVIALLSPPELEEELQQLLSREGNFAVNLREGLRHNVKISTSSSEINIQMDPLAEGSPCKILAILYDQFGNKIGETVPDETGNVNFSNLDKGTYNVAMEVQPPCQGGSIAYALNDPNNQITAQHNEEYTPATDSLSYDIEGFVDFKDADLPKEGVQVMLVDQDNKQVKAKQQTQHSGEFSFKNLVPGNYKVVYEVPSAKVQSRIAYNIKDNKEHMVKQENFPFNDITNKPKDGTRLMAGKLELNDPSIQAYKLSLDLVDQYNRVVDHSIPNDDGTFEFIDRKSDHNDIILDIADKKLEKELNTATASSKGGAAAIPLVRSISYEPKVEEAKRMEELLAGSSAEPGVKPAMGTKAVVTTSEMEMYKLYNIEGEASNVEGFGYQVGAFRNLQNVFQLMDKLKKEGFEVFVQAIMSNDINTRFRTSQNYKMNRIIVYGGNNDAHANDVKQKLTQEGYTIIVKEHFKPGANAPGLKPPEKKPENADK